MDDQDKDVVEESRRKFLKTAAKIAVYTPPAMIVASRPSFATFADSSGSEPGGSQDQTRRKAKKKTKKTRKKATKKYWNRAKKRAKKRAAKRAKKRTARKKASKKNAD